MTAVIEIAKKWTARYLFFWAGLVLAERRPRIIGVTGSVGKTTSKEAIATVLIEGARRGRIDTVGKSENNLNSELGLPLAILRFHQSPGNSLIGWLVVFVAVPFRAIMLATILAYPSILVLEYAADRPGDIARLVKLARPLVACITAVGPAHLERFGSIDRVLEEKGNLARASMPDGLVVLPKDDRVAMRVKKWAPGRVVAVPGRGLDLAVAIAIQVGRYFGVSEKVAKKVLKGFHSLHGRLEHKKIGSIEVIDDTYNANPLSMELALDTLTERAKRGVRRVAILGDMRELGPESPAFHEVIGRQARQQADLVIGVGELARYYLGQAWYPTSQQASQEIVGFLRPKDLVLVKGSRGIHMERIVQAIIQGWKGQRDKR